MGKSKQTKEKKFDRNIEISAPILDPEIIKAIHSPPKGGQRVDIKHGGFKALLSDLNSQDSTDELMPLNDHHVPSYIGVSCAVSGYSSYSPYSKRINDSVEQSQQTNKTTTSAISRSRATSPVSKITHQVNHIVIDKTNIQSIEDERRELTQKLTASATERRRSPSPLVQPIEDDRHHGAYVGARYCPLPPPSKVINKHIPLLGIDDDQDPDEVSSDDTHKVEEKIASLYGENFVEDWRESMTHKSKKELASNDTSEQTESTKSPKDLVNLRPTPQPTPVTDEVKVDVPTPNIKVLAGVEKQFLTKLLTDENPPMPKSPISTVSPTREEIVSRSPQLSPVATKQIRDSPIGSPASPVEQVVTPDPIPTHVIGISSTTASQQDMLVNVGTPSPKPMSPNLDSLSEFPVIESLTNISNEQTSESCVTKTVLPEDPTGIPDQSIEFSNTELVLENDMLMGVDSPELTRLDDTIVINDDDRSMSPPKSTEHPDNTDESAPAGSKIEEEHIEYEITTQSQVDNQSSPVRVVDVNEIKENYAEQLDSLNSDQNIKVENDLVRMENEDETINNNNNYVDDLVTSEVVEDLETKRNQEESQKQEDSSMEAPCQGDASPDGKFYLELLEAEKSFISDQVRLAELWLEEDEANLDEDTLGKIRSAIGKANLFMNSKCNQFKELCEANLKVGGDDNMTTKQQFATLNDDLAGFWDMLAYQVSDVRKSFEALWESKNSK